MNTLELVGEYHSSYTMESSSGLVIVEDTINIGPAKRFGKLSGVGIRDADGLQLELRLWDTEAGNKLWGGWMEIDRNGDTVDNGIVEFVPGDDGRLYGFWTSNEDTPEDEIESGTWVLVRTLGESALQHTGE